MIKNPETNKLQQVSKDDSEGKPVKDIDYGHDHGAEDPHVHSGNIHQILP
ncbi:hypothetical protein U2T78_002963 [Providencia stuartii]|uniref:Uncharacterized protein n=1 Tax=Providencia stuartii TaxID=588 RepID=A0AAJ1JH83_PROST|nr:MULTISPECIES: hypothetical protein [Providencia]EKW6535333.1 hypothetical protein [Proteus mirabilis]EMA3642217.1 hypothetical protein [Providencia stuartii]MBW3102645.1 hypothetical protein [Providencia stuartii]MDE5308742.1 hypothetical protein [Providencia stuartii]MDE8749631.1 hypothetical protein [Providencia thailandensis]